MDKDKEAPTLTITLTFNEVVQLLNAYNMPDSFKDQLKKFMEEVNFGSFG